MSQLNVEEMKTWSRDECKTRLDDVLPKLVEIITISKSTEEFLGALELLCKNFLPAMPIESVESLVLCKVLPHAKETFVSISTSVKARIFEMDFKVANEFEQLFAILDCLDLCVNNCAVIIEQAVILEYIYSLPVPVLKIALRSFELYGECKCDTYQRVGENLSEQLDCLFNRTTSLTKSFLSLWEKLKISIALENDVQLTVEVCSLLKEICRVFAATAGKSPIALWKVYVNTLVKYCDGIKDRVDVSSTIELLCENVQQNLLELATLVSQTDSSVKEQKATAVRSLQICGFCLKIIVTLCEKFKFYLGDCFRSLLYLILNVYKFCPPSLTRPNLPANIEKEVERNLGIVIEPLLSGLILEPQFISALNAENLKLNLESDFHFPMCLLQLFILENAFQLTTLDKSKEMFQPVDASTTLFHNFFEVFSKCSIELSFPVHFPGVMCNGKPQRMVSFYEFVCTRFCGFVVALPATYFPVLERVMIRQLLSLHVWNSLLVCDVWTFLGRLESPQLCFHHCCCIAEIVSLGPPENINDAFATILLKRLFNLLATEHKMQFLKRYPPPLHHRVWLQIYTLPVWGGAYDIRHLEIIADGILNEIGVLISENNGGIQADDQLPKTAFCLHSIGQIANLTKKMSPEFGRKILNFCLLLWKFTPFHLLMKKAESESTEFVVHLIVLTGCLLPIMENKDIVEVQRRLLYLQSSDSHAIKLAVYKMIHHLALKTISSTVQQSHILQASASLLSSCLGSSNVILAQKGLETFANFSYDTQHEIIVARCLQMNPQARETVKQFLNRVPQDLPSKYIDLLSVLQTQVKLLDSKAVYHDGKGDQSILELDTVKKIPKDENSAKEALECLESSIHRLVAAADSFKQQIPHWLRVGVQISLDKLSNVLQM